MTNKHFLDHPDVSSFVSLKESDVISRSAPTIKYALEVLEKIHKR